jgi:hypothetical protein
MLVAGADSRHRTDTRARGVREVVDDQLDVPLEDATLMEEVELISTLMIAASENEGHLEPTEIDRLLGVPDSSPPRKSSSER